jgi:hypothetical protein
MLSPYGESAIVLLVALAATSPLPFDEIGSDVNCRAMTVTLSQLGSYLRRCDSGSGVCDAIVPSIARLLTRVTIQDGERVAQAIWLALQNAEVANFLKGSIAALPEDMRSIVRMLLVRHPPKQDAALLPTAQAAPEPTQPPASRQPPQRLAINIASFR